MRERPRAWDLVVATTATLALWASADVLVSFTRPLALAAALTLPGYALTSWIFPFVRGSTPRPGGLTGLERAGASFLFSLALIPIEATLLDAAGRPFSSATLASCTFLVTAAASALALRQRRGAPSFSRFDGRILGRSWVSASRAAWRPGRLALAFAAIAILVGCVVVVQSSTADRGFVEALLLPPSGHLRDVPDHVDAPEAVPFDLVLRSHFLADHEVSVEIIHERWPEGIGLATQATVSEPTFRATLLSSTPSLPPATNVTTPFEVAFLDPGFHRITIVVEGAGDRALSLHTWVTAS